MEKKNKSRILYVSIWTNIIIMKVSTYLGDKGIYLANMDSFQVLFFPGYYLAQMDSFQVFLL